MKRKIKILVAFVIVISIFASTFAGCTLIVKNKDREANEVLTTVTRNGITLEISKNSFLDYFNSLYSQNAQYIQYGYFTVEQILDAAIEGKIKNTYLLTDAMVYLTDKSKVGDTRHNVLKGKGAKVKLEDVLTYAEWAEAVYSVNKSIDDQIEAAKENAYQTQLDKVWRKTDKTGVKGIEFTEETKEYLKETYYENDKIDFDKIKIVVIYDEEIDGADGTKVNRKSEELIPAKGNYTKEFATTFGEQENDGVKKTFEITFNESPKNVDDEPIPHTVSHEYTLKKSRATKDKIDELEGVLDRFKINDITVGRYDNKAQLKDKGIDLDGTDDASKLYKIRDLEKEAEQIKKTSSDENLVEGYRVVTERMKASYKNMDYYYYSAFELSVSNAFKSEIYQKALKDYSDEDLARDTMAELKYLREKNKAQYGSDLEKNKKDFVKAIGEKLDNVYYYPKMDDTTEQFFVLNLLFKFSEEDQAFLSEHTPGNGVLTGTTEEVVKGYREYLAPTTTTEASNPDYDKEHECPLHKDGKEGETCSFSEDATGIKDGKICPSIRYGRIADDGTLKINGVDEDYAEKILDVMARLEAELVAVENDETKSAEEKQRASIEIFERYMYSYNDDAGCMNKPSGYYGKTEGFAKEFLELSQEVFDYNPTVGNAFVSPGKIGYAYTSFGLHIVMISAVPFKDATNNEDLSFENDEELKAYYKTEYDVNGNSIYKNVEKQLKDQKKTQAYLNFTTEHVPTKLITRNEKDNKVTLEKSLKKEVKIDAKKLKGIFDLFLKNKG